MSRRVPTYTAAQVRAAEQPLLDAGVPLMARAAAALAGIVRHETTDAATARILVLAGAGNNGGDALFAAARLGNQGAARIDVLATGTRLHEAGLAAAVAAGARLIDLGELTGTITAEGYDVVLDGILGIGTAADPSLRGTARAAVDALLPAVAAGRTRVYAVDLPSGLHPDTGETGETGDANGGVVLPASVTVTFGAVKAGLARGRGPELAGLIVLVDLGFELDGESAGQASVDRIVAG